MSETAVLTTAELTTAELTTAVPTTAVTAGARMPRRSLPRFARPARVCAVVALLAATTACAAPTPIPVIDPPPLRVCGTLNLSAVVDWAPVRVADEVCTAAGAPLDGTSVEGPDGPPIRWWTAATCLDAENRTEIGDQLDDAYIDVNSPVGDDPLFTPPPVSPRCAPTGDAS